MTCINFNCNSETRGIVSHFRLFHIPKNSLFSIGRLDLHPYLCGLKRKQKSEAGYQNKKNDFPR
jgi:hypothetical protein